MKQETSLQTRLEEQISRQVPGELIFPGDFLELGAVTAIHMSLSRMVRKKMLTRIGKGIYLRPQIHPELGPVLPSLDAIAKAVAEKEQVIIRPTGSYALNMLGLSTQVPTKVVYLTNGSRRRIRIGRGVITFKQTTPKNLAAKNEIVFLVIQSLIELGEHRVNKKVRDTLTEKLQFVPIHELREDAKFAPQFASQILYSIANELAHHG